MQKGRRCPVLAHFPGRLLTKTLPWPAAPYCRHSVPLHHQVEVAPGRWWMFPLAPCIHWRLQVCGAPSHPVHAILPDIPPPLNTALDPTPLLALSIRHSTCPSMCPPRPCHAAVQWCGRRCPLLRCGHVCHWCPLQRIAQYSYLAVVVKMIDTIVDSATSLATCWVDPIAGRWCGSGCCMGSSNSLSPSTPFLRLSNIPRRTARHTWLQIQRATQESRLEACILILYATL